MRLTIMFLLLSLSVSAQIPNFQKVTGKWNYSDSMALSKYKNNLAGDSVLSTDNNGKLKMKKITGTGAAVDTIYRIVGVDSIYWIIGGIVHAIKDSASGSASGLNAVTAIDSNTNHLVSFHSGIKFTDSSYNESNFKYFNPLGPGHTDTIIIPHKSGTMALLGDITDSLNSRGGSTNTGVGSGYQVAINGTNNIKSLTAGLDLLIDSSTTNQVNYKLDTSGVHAQFLAKGDSTIYATIYQNSLKVNISDTANMLLPYMEYSDTATLSNRINSKVNISDTSSMLTPYVNSVGYGITKTGQSVKADTATLFPAIRATIPVGGGTLDSVYQTLTVGATPNFIGTLIQTDWTAGSLPSGWTKGSGLTNTYTGGKTHIVGASSLGAPTAGNITQQYASGLQYNNKRMPYEKLDFSMNIVPQTKAANNIVGVYKGVMGFGVSSNEGIAWDLSNDSTSGRVTIYGAGGSSIPTFNVSGDSSSFCAFSVGDSLVLYYHKDGWSLTAGIINKTTGKMSKTYFNGIWNGSGGLFNLVFLNGTYDLTAVKVSSFDRKGVVWFFGDSQWSGSGNTQESRRLPNVVMNNNYKYFGVWGLPSLEAKYAVNGGLMSELLTDAQPSQIVVGLAYNDRAQGEGAPATKTNTDSLVYPAIRSIGAANVSLSGIIPQYNNTSVYDDSLQHLATTRNIAFYPIRNALLQNSLYLNSSYNYDNVHINDSGAIVVANVMRSVNGFTLLQASAKDSNFVSKTYGLPTAQTSSIVGIKGVQSDGKDVLVPNTLPNPSTWIQNKYSAVAGTVAQGSSQVHTTQPVISDSSFEVHNSNGLQIGFNGGSISNAGTTGANINITDGGVAVFGYPQIFNSISGKGNINIIASSLNKPRSTIGTSTISGNNNTFINSVAATSTTGSNVVAIGAYGYGSVSGSNNIALGSDAGLGTTSASNSIWLTTKNTGGSSFANTSSVQLYGEVNGGGASLVTGDVVWNNGVYNNQQFYFGGKTTGATTFTMNAPSGATTWQFNSQGSTPSFISTKPFYFANTNSTPDTSAQVHIISTTKGFLLPRMGGTQIAAISTPATGLLAYDNVADKLLHYNSSIWNPFIDSTTANSKYLQIASNDSLKHLFVDTSASPRNNYVLAFDSTNHKWKLVANSGGGGGGTGTVTSISQGWGIVNTPNPIIATGIVAGDSTQHATSSNTGYLSNIDWTTFNNKLNISDTSAMLAPFMEYIDTATLSNRINLKQDQLNGTGFVKVTGTTISYDNSTYLSSVDTTNITNFSGKVRSEFSLTTTGTSGASTYNSATGTFNIPNYSGTGTTQVVNEEFTGSTSASLTLANSGVSGTLQVWKNGLLLPVAKFTYSGGTSVTLTDARLSGDIISCAYKY